MAPTRRRTRRPVRRAIKAGGRKNSRNIRRQPRRKIRAPVGVPNQQFIKFKYTEILGANSLSSAAPSHAFIKINDLIDPQPNGIGDFSAVAGHTSNGQPMYRDQWALIYRNFKVYSAKITATWQPYTVDPTNDPAPSIGCMVLMADSGILGDSDIEVSRQRTGAKYMNFGGAIGYSKPVTLSMYTKCYKILGMSKERYNDSSVSEGVMTGAGTSPTNSPYFSIAVQNMSAAQPLSGYLRITVKFYTKLYHPNFQVAAS